MKILNLFKEKLCIVIIFLLFLLLQNQTVNAEQTIINIPSSEIQPFGNLIIKESNGINPFIDDKSYAITPSVTVGVGHGMQLTGGVATTIRDSTTVRGNFGLKKVFFVGNASRFTLGGSISPYFSHGYTPESFMYTHFSHRIKKTKTSLTLGGYIHGDRYKSYSPGVLLGLEQVIIPNKLRFAVDWLSGENSYSRLGVGLKYRPEPTLSITGAVIIPNKDSENIAFSLSLSKFITLPRESIKGDKL